MMAYESLVKRINDQVAQIEEMRKELQFLRDKNIRRSQQISILENVLLKENYLPEEIKELTKDLD